MCGRAVEHPSFFVVSGRVVGSIPREDIFVVLRIANAETRMPFFAAINWHGWPLIAMMAINCVARHFLPRMPCCAHESEISCQLTKVKF